VRSCSRANCVYLDLDGKDEAVALHLIGEYEGEIVAHTPFKPGISFDNASIGRVVVDANYRN
jgi:ElaA protein